MPKKATTAGQRKKQSRKTVAGKKAVKKRTLKQQARGRSRGSRNRKYDTSHGRLTACKKCGSTTRSPYFSRIERRMNIYQCDRDTCDRYASRPKACPCGGQLRMPRSHIVHRRTRCCSCGQFRVDIHLENRPDEQKKTAKK